MSASAYDGGTPLRVCVWGKSVYWSSTCKTDFLAGKFFRFPVLPRFQKERGEGGRKYFGREGENRKCFGEAVSVLGSSQEWGGMLEIGVWFEARGGRGVFAPPRLHAMYRQIIKGGRTFHILLRFLTASPSDLSTRPVTSRTLRSPFASHTHV